MDPQKRAELQSVKEWVLENETGVPVAPGSLNGAYKPWVHENNNDSNVVKFEQSKDIILSYDSYRTAKKYGKGTVILSFIDENTGEEVVAFFNVDVYRQRGPMKGSPYRVGKNGQFLPPARGKFRKFCKYVLGIEPSRWSQVHKILNKAFKGRRFTGEIKTKYDKNDSLFLEVDKSTITELISDNLETK